MIHHTHSTGALAGALFLVGVVSGEALAQTTIYPPSGTGGGYVIAVVSDGYVSSEEWKFDRAVDGLILNGLMQDPFYSSHGSAFTIKKTFKASPQSQQSLFQIKPNYDLRRCYIDYVEGDTTKAIDDVVKDLAPMRVVVVGNYEGVSLGCRVDNWTYVSAGAREIGGVLEHEFGHLIAGLFDEYTLNPPPFTDEVDRLNCSTKETPYWFLSGGLPASATTIPTNEPGCLLYESESSHLIVRPYKMCMMRAAGAPFCDICSGEMADQLASVTVVAPISRLDRIPLLRSLSEALIVHAAFMQQPARKADPRQPATVPPTEITRRPAQPPSARPPAPHVRLLIEVKNDQDAAKRTTRVVSATDVTAPVVTRIRNVGTYAWEALEDGKPIATGVFPGDPFQRAPYGNAGAPHPAAQPIAVSTVVVMIPNRTLEELRKRSIDIVFFKLKPSAGREEIPPGWFEDTSNGDKFGEFVRLPNAALQPSFKK
jgi:IgA Peptidase M64